VDENRKHQEENARLLKEALVLHRRNSLEEAKKLYTQIQSKAPNHFDSLQLLGLAAFQQEMHQDAIRLFGMALKVNPRHALTHFHLGLAFKKLKLLVEALASFNNAIAIDPQYAQAYQGRANTFLEMAKYDLAFADYQKAIQVKPDFADALLGIGNLHKKFKQYSQALKAYETAKTIAPDLPYLKGILLNTKMLLGDWNNFNADLQGLELAIQSDTLVSAPFPLLALSESPVILKKSSELYSQVLYPPNNALGPIGNRTPNNKLRIGYFSTDLHDHAIAHLTAELFELHDQQRFETFAFSYSPVTNDPMQLRLRKAFSQFIEVSNKSDIDIAKLARDLEIDIAVDLTGYTQNSRTGIFSYRAAPIQVNYLGYPGTMGAKYMDYLIADKTVIPEEDQGFYTEKILYMPHCYQVNDRKREASPRIFTKQECGLPENNFVFCCFNNSYKITPSTFDSWMNILKACPDSVLWLLESQPEANENLRKEALLRGVDPNRLVFAGRLSAAEHLNRIQLADLFLDTTPYNAHTTCSDALWMGVPVLTQYGKTFPSRVAASLLKAIELSNLITTSTLEYEKLAIELAKNPDELNAIKLRLKNNRLKAPLFNTASFTNALEQHYEDIYRFSLLENHQRS